MHGPAPQEAARTALSSRWLAARRFVFGGYAGGLFVATHWPNVKIHGPVVRTDLWIHLAVFSSWTAFMIAAAAFGRSLSRRNVALSVLVALVYAAIDESLQAIPVLHRVAAFDDYAANASGILIAGIAALAIGEVARSLGRGSAHERDSRA